MLQHILLTFIKPLLYTFPAWIVYRVYRNKVKKQSGERWSAARECLLFTFYLYLLLLGTLTLLPQMDLSHAIPESSQVNLVPILKNYYKYKEAAVCGAPVCVYNWVANIFVNILLFLPLGLLLPIISKKIKSLRSVALVAFCLSAAIEIFQYFLTYWKIYRFSDVDDIILNVSGAALGYFIFEQLPLKESKPPF